MKTKLKIHSMNQKTGHCMTPVQSQTSVLPLSANTGSRMSLQQQKFLENDLTNPVLD